MWSQKNCIGCRTFFEQNQTLSLETLSYEYKNYDIPFQQAKHKWGLLKTIVSLLNSKGGTILIGIEDSNCRVVGKLLSGKVRDEFKLFLKQLTDRISPPLDLTNKEELSVQYVPVVKGKTFSGKYVTKINVQQGDPNQTYCFVQRIQMALQTKETPGQQLEIVYSYVRHNMGGTEQLKGIKLVQESIKKAINPPPVTKTFHEECNPDPSQFQVQIKKIGFKGFGSRDKRRAFQHIFKQNLGKLQVKYEMSYQTQRETLMIEFQSVAQFKKVNTFILANLSFLNETQEEIKFADAGEFLDFYLYENAYVSKVEKQESKGSPKKQSHTQISKAKEKKVESKQRSSHSQAEQSQTRPQMFQTKKHSITFTHINPSTKDKLLNYLTTNISQKIAINHQMYENTIEVFFKQKSDQVKYNQLCRSASNQRALSQFGFKSEIRMGVNTGHLHILNYDKKKLNQLKSFLQKLMGKDLKDIEILKNGNRYIMDCKMAKNRDACEWLDLLLKNKQIKHFRLSGAQNGVAPKMKIFIQTESIKNE